MRVLGIFICLAGIGMCLKIAGFRFSQVSHKKTIHLGVVALSLVGFYKLMALVGLVLAPTASMGAANAHLFASAPKLDSCNKCHVMRPMVNDLRDPESQTLAARHHRNRWIIRNDCYECHADYGFAGSVQAKMDGYRHLARYVTGTYTEPIKFRGVYNNANCLRCHGGTQKFEGVSSHATVKARLRSNDLSCLNCHGAAHPSRARRTPGHRDYEQWLKESWK